MRNVIVFLFILLFFSACKKVEIREVQVPVEKKTSWTEIKRFQGTQRIFLSSGSSADAIYLQQPFFFTELRTQDPERGIKVYGAYLPSDIYMRMPINGSLFAHIYSGSHTVLRVRNNQQPTSSPTGGTYDLKQIDPTMTSVQTNYLDRFKSMGISTNNTLLLAYANNRPQRVFTFMLLKMNVTRDYPFVDTIYTKAIAIPKNGWDGYVRHIKAVDDYFLIDLSDDGIFKIREDGSFRRVNKPAVIDAFYAWKDKVYAHAEWGTVFISEDKGENWQEFTGVDDAMTLSQYFVVKDSLVGAYRDNLFTLRWDGPNYFMRALKNDGLESTAINGVEVLRDSVYVATTSGLYTKSVKEFFESKK